MPANTTHGLPYPLGTDRVMDGDNAIKALAEAVDPPFINLATVAQAGWTIQTQRLVVAGPLVCLYMAVTRTGADIVISAAGNVGDSAVFSGFPVQYLPSQTANTYAPLTFWRTGTGTAYGHVNVAGDGSFTHGAPGVTYAGSGTPYRIDAVWMIGSIP